MKNPGPLFIITGLDPMEVNEAYQKEMVAWRRTRLLVIRLAMGGAHHREEVAAMAGCSLSAVASSSQTLPPGRAGSPPATQVQRAQPMPPFP